MVVAPGRSLVPSFTTGVAHESHRTLVAKKTQWMTELDWLYHRVTSEDCCQKGASLRMSTWHATPELNIENEWNQHKATISTWGLPKKNLPSLHLQSWTSWKTTAFNLAKLRCAYLWEMLRIDATSRAGWKQCCAAAIGFHRSTVQLYLPHKALVSVSTQHFTLMSVNLCFTTFQAAQ